MKLRRHQLGLTTVEVALIGLLMFTTLFAVIEVGRLVFVYGMLEESTRRGARLAAVCTLNDPDIARIAVFGTAGGGGGSSIVAGLNTNNIEVQYLNTAGGPIADPVGNFVNIEFVRVAIINFEHQFIVPVLNAVFTTPRFETTLPRESLGVTRDGLSTC